MSLYYGQLCLFDVRSAPTPGACTHIRKIFFFPIFLLISSTLIIGMYEYLLNSDNQK